MRVNDIFPEACEYLGTNDQLHVFRTLGRACEYLANKGNFDILKGYVDLPVQRHNIVVLPRQVDTPLKFTMDEAPAFSRDRLFEFSLNGFGSGGGGPDRQENSWEDRGFTPLMVVPSLRGFPSFKVTVTHSVRDAGKKVLLQGKNTNGTEVTETLVISASAWVTSVYEYEELTEVAKDITRDYVGLYVHAPPPPQTPPFGPTDTTLPETSPDALRAPMMAPNSGSYRYPLRVVIEASDRLDGLTLMYTLDGSDPTVTNGIAIPGWAGDVLVTQSPQVVKAVEVLNGVAGPIKENTYTVTAGGILNAPVINPITGNYPLPLLVAIDAVDPNSGITLMYTTDGSDPTLTNGIPVNGWHVDFNVNSYPTIVKACEIERNTTAGPITAVGYGLTPPIINPDSGDYLFPLQAQILGTNQTSNYAPTFLPEPISSLKYTTDGTDPSTTNGTLVTDPNGYVVFNTPPVTLKACQIVNGVASPITRRDYTGGPQPAPGPDTDPPQPVPPTPPGWTLLAVYWPFETSPKYRMVRLSQVGVTCRFLFRRKVFKIQSLDDFIPIASELGLLTMLQAIQALRRKDFEVAKASADAAVEITTDAQSATTGFIELANNTEIQQARNYQIWNRDSVIVMDVFDEFAKILGNVGENQIFDTITECLEILCTKGHYDGLTGYVDILTDGRRYVTLPRFVDQPVAISINGRPAYMRNKWSEFHLNGPGSDEYGGQHMGGVQFGSWYGFSGSGRWGQIRAWDSVGEVVTIAPLSAVSQLVAIPDDVTDDGKTITVYGYDDTGKWIRTNGLDGFVVTINHNKLVPNINADQKVAKIERVFRQSTRGFVRLIAYDTVDQTTSVQLGYYYPDETEPKYFRIRLPTDASWIRLRYRKRTLRVTSIWQPLHLHSRTAIVTMCRSLKLLDTDAATAQAMEDKAVKYLDDDQKARNPGETFQLQFNEDCGWNSNFICS